MFIVKRVKTTRTKLGTFIANQEDNATIWFTAQGHSDGNLWVYDTYADVAVEIFQSDGGISVTTYPQASQSTCEGSFLRIKESSITVEMLEALWV